MPSNKRLHNFADAALQCHSLCPSFQTSGDCQPGMHIATRPSTMHCVSYAVCTTLCNLGPQPCGSPGGACAAGSCSWRGWSAREPVHRRIASPTRHRAALPPGKSGGTDKMTSGEIETWSTPERNHLGSVMGRTDVSQAGHASHCVPITMCLLSRGCPHALCSVTLRHLAEDISSRRRKLKRLDTPAHSYSNTGD